DEPLRHRGPGRGPDHRAGGGPRLAPRRPGRPVAEGPGPGEGGPVAGRALAHRPPDSGVRPQDGGVRLRSCNTSLRLALLLITAVYVNAQDAGKTVLLNVQAGQVPPDTGLETQTKFE